MHKLQHLCLLSLLALSALAQAVKTTPPPHKSAKCPSPPPFLGYSPLYIAFFVTPPKKSDFSVNPKNI